MITQPSHGINMINDVIVLAEHCLIHGICGKVERENTGQAVEEFDAYSFMELARIHLGFSSQEASNMTMTEFSRMMEAKFPPERNENVASKKEQQNMLAWFNEQESKKVH